MYNSLSGYLETSSNNNQHQRRLIVMFVLPLILSTFSFISYFINNSTLNIINMIIFYLSSLFAISSNYMVYYYDNKQYNYEDIYEADEENQIYSQYKKNDNKILNNNNLIGYLESKTNNEKIYYTSDIVHYALLWAIGKNVRSNFKSNNFKFLGLKINNDDCELP
jgi:hypothetical protein